jgi:hypothetical protein
LKSPSRNEDGLVVAFAALYMAQCFVGGEKADKKTVEVEDKRKARVLRQAGRERWQ